MIDHHALVADYLRRLEAATSDLPPDVRDDLRADVAGHLDQIQRDAVDEADLRTRLERLGPPEVIGAEARAGVPAPERRPVRSHVGSRWRDGVTVVLLAVGAVIGAIVLLPIAPIGALLGWVTGVVLLWTSASWRPGEKAVGTLVWPGGVAAPLVLGLMGGQVCPVVEENLDGAGQVVETCEGFALPVWLGVPVFIAAVAAPIVVAAMLIRRADRRRMQAPRADTIR